MKILILGTILNILLFSSCHHETVDDITSSDMQKYADSLNYNGDLFEVSFPKSYSITKRESKNTPLTAYIFKDSLKRSFMSLTHGSHADFSFYGKIRQNQLDSFFLEDVVNKSYFKDDSLKIRKYHIFDINLSSDCDKIKVKKSLVKEYEKKGFKVLNDSCLVCFPVVMWFAYDSAAVDESVCKKIISSLKYRKKNK